MGHAAQQAFYLLLLQCTRQRINMRKASIKLPERDLDVKELPQIALEVIVHRYVRTLGPKILQNVLEDGRIAIEEDALVRQNLKCVLTREDHLHFRSSDRGQ